MNTPSLASLLLLFPALAHAQPAPAIAAQAEPADEPSFALTWSPVHLAIPLFELTFEARITPKVGVAVIAGGGATRVDTIPDPIRLLEGGASVRYYVLGTFKKGVQLGGEVLYVHANVDDPSVDIRARGLALSPFVGGKWTHSSGFTLDGQLGVSFMTLRADSMSTTAADSDIGALLNLNAGWSF